MIVWTINLADAIGLTIVALFVLWCTGIHLWNRFTRRRAVREFNQRRRERLDRRAEVERDARGAAMKRAAMYAIAIAGALTLAGSTFPVSALMVGYRRPAHAFAAWGVV